MEEEYELYGIFTMHNGEISGNTSGHDGGGVSAGTVIMHNGKISGNDSSHYVGGGVSTANFTMYDGEISGNTAHWNGGGVFINFGRKCYNTCRNN